MLQAALVAHAAIGYGRYALRWRRLRAAYGIEALRGGEVKRQRQEDERKQRAWR